MTRAEGWGWEVQMRVEEETLKMPQLGQQAALVPKQLSCGGWREDTYIQGRSQIPQSSHSHRLRA